METLLKIKLIDGIFGQKDAKEVITQLLNENLNFHIRKNFDSTIKSGIPNVVSVERIEELKKEITRIMTYFNQDSVLDRKFSIEAVIHLQPLEKE